MNNEQIKEKLLQIKRTDKDFSVVLSGKKSKKVDGLYKTKSREIIIHNKNFTTEDELMYTAIHEYAHHIQFSESSLPISTRSHTNRFWHTFHTLLFKAEELGLYKNVFDSNDEFKELTEKIKNEIFRVNGGLMKEFGRLLAKARELCEKYHTSFEDYIDRILNLPRTSANTIMKTFDMDLDERIGFENMRVLTRIGDSEKREEAQVALLSGQSPDMVRMQFIARQEEKNTVDALKAEKQRIEKTISTLKLRLEELNKRIKETDPAENYQKPFADKKQDGITEQENSADDTVILNIDSRDNLPEDQETDDSSKILSFNKE
jgi:hypothetical protein